MNYALNYCFGMPGDNENEVVFIGPCIETGKEYSVTVTKEGLRRYLDENVAIQDAFPNLSTDDREFLMTGYSPEGWNIAFPSEDDYDN